MQKISLNIIDKEYSIKSIVLSLLIGFLFFIFLASEYTFNIKNESLIYIVEYIEQYKIKYILLFLYSIFFFVSISNRKFFLWKKELISFLLLILIFVIVSLIFQSINGFRSFLINEVLFFLAPIIFVFCFINYSNGKISHYINVTFWICVFWWCVCYFPILNIDNIKSISFISSYSPFESEYAHLFMFYFIYFLCKKYKLSSVICGILLFLSFKRMNIVFEAIAIIFFVIFRKKTLNISPKIINLFTIIFAIFFIICPFIVQKLCEDSFALWFNATFNYDWNRFIMGRFDRINWCVDEGMKYGFGSTTDYLTSLMGGKARNIHCDILRVYLETTIFGTIAYTFTYFRLANKNVFTLFAILALFTDSLVNHYFGAGHCLLMIVIYFVIYELSQNYNYIKKNSNTILNLNL